MATSEEGRLVEAARAGDQQAFGRLFDHWFDRVHDLSRRIVRDDGIAGEVAQDAFLKAWTKLDTLEDPDAFGGWLLRIARNASLNRLERERRSVAIGDDTMTTLTDRDAPDHDPLDRMDQAAGVSLVWDAAAALGERDASVLDLHLRHGLSGAELAEELGCTPNNAHQVLFTMRKRLEKAVRALVLWRAGRPSCPDLGQGLAAAGLTSFGAPMVKAIDRHVDGCPDCAGDRAERLSPAALFAAAPIVAAPILLKSAAASGLAAAGVPMAGSAAAAAVGSAAAATALPGAGGAGGTSGSAGAAGGGGAGPGGPGGTGGPAGSGPGAPGAGGPAGSGPGAPGSGPGGTAPGGDGGSVVGANGSPGGAPGGGTGPVGAEAGPGSIPDDGPGSIGGDAGPGSLPPNASGGPLADPFVAAGPLGGGPLGGAGPGGPGGPVIPFGLPGGSGGPGPGGERRRRVVLGGALAAAIVLVVGLVLLFAGVDAGDGTVETAGPSTTGTPTGADDPSTTGADTTATTDQSNGTSTTATTGSTTVRTLVPGTTGPPPTGSGGDPTAPPVTDPLTGETTPGGTVTPPGTRPTDDPTPTTTAPPRPTTTSTTSTTTTTTEPARPPRIDRFVASPSATRCRGGYQWGLTWATTDAEVVTLGSKGGDTAAVEVDGKGTRCAPSGTVFTRTAAGPGGSVTATAGGQTVPTTTPTTIG